jgi:hypothetical protein
MEELGAPRASHEGWQLGPEPWASTLDLNPHLRQAQLRRLRPAAPSPRLQA